MNKESSINFDEILERLNEINKSNLTKCLDWLMAKNGNIDFMEQLKSKERK